jgi:hypothetical protein
MTASIFTLQNHFSLTFPFPETSRKNIAYMKREKGENIEIKESRTDKKYRIGKLMKTIFLNQSQSEKYTELNRERRTA